MWFYTCVIVALTVGAARKAADSLRKQSRRRRFRSAGFAQLCAAGAFATGALLSLVSDRQVDAHIGMAASVCATVSGFLTWQTSRLRGLEVYRSGAIALGSRLRVSVRSRRETATAAFTHFVSTVAPAGRHGLAWPRITFEGLLFRLTFFFVVALFALSPVIIAVVVLGTLNAETSPMSTFAPVLLQYIVLLTAACWSIPVIITWLLLLFLRLIGVIDWRLDVLRYSSTIAAVAGIGLVLGASVAVLLPVFASVPPFSTAGTEIYPIDGARPDLLLSATGVGGVLGFLIGQLIALSTLCRQIPNTILGTLTPPLLFLLSSIGLSMAGLNPASTLKRIAALLDGRVVELGTHATAEAAAAAFEDWRVVLLFISETSDGWFPGAVPFIWITAIATLVCAFGGLMREYRSRVAASGRQ